MIILAHSLQGKSATYMVQPSTLAEFLFMMAFISAWHTYMYFVSSLEKERKVFKTAPRCYYILILWGFSPGQLLIRAPPERIDIWSLWENVNDYLGNPLYPMPTILLSSLTIHAPTCTGILDSSCFYFPKRAYLCCRILAPHGGEEGHRKEVLRPLQVFFPGLLGEQSQKKYGI